MLGTHLTKAQISELTVDDIKSLSVVNLLDVVSNIDSLSQDLIKVVLVRMAEKLKYSALPNDYYRSTHEDHTVNDGDFLADKLSDFVNGRNSQRAVRHFVERVTLQEHRYLQSEIFHLVMKLIEGWALAFDATHYDSRNEFACTMSKYLKQAIDNYKY